jgi:hypothetical protein
MSELELLPLPVPAVSPSGGDSYARILKRDILAKADPLSLFTYEQAADYLNISLRQLQELVIAKRGPDKVDFAHRTKRFRKCDLDSWTASRVRRGSPAVKAV